MTEAASILAPGTVRELALPLTLDRAAADNARLEIACSFASDAIIDDPDCGPVRLSMDPAAVDLTVARARGIPVRIMHLRDLPIARVFNARIEGAVMRGILRFSQSQRGRELYQDALDGILTDLSVGAAVSAVMQKDDCLLAVRWAPKEVSIVDFGADPSVGINRAAPSIPPAAPAAGIVTTEVTMSDSNPAAAPADGSTGPASPAAATSSNGANTANIIELARYATERYPDLGVQRLADDHVACGQPFEVFRGKVWSLISEHQAQRPGIAAPTPAAQLGLSQREAQSFSIVRACNAVLSGDWKRAGFELEASRAVADRLGRAPRGFFVPLEVQTQMGQGALIQRAETLSTGNPTYGGFLVGTDHRPDLFIDALRATSVCLSAGVRTLPGLTGNLSIPKKTGVASFSWISEGEDAPDTDIPFGAVAMSPRTIAGGIAMTRRLLQQSSPAIEQLVRTDLVDGCALALDLAILEGDGVKAPRGLINHPDINTQSINTAGSPTWAEIVGFETEVETDNALAGNLAYVTTPAVVGKMKTTAKATNQAIFLIDQGGQVNGYPVRRTTQLTTHRILFGDWSQVMVGFWGVLDIKPDEAKLAASGGLVIRVFQDADVAIRQGAAFCKNT
jgi:HK97 family phage major capsid protein